MSDTLKMTGKQESVDLKCNHTFSGMHSATFEFNSSESEEKDAGKMRATWKLTFNVVVT